jgi:hypothetical protein
MMEVHWMTIADILLQAQALSPEERKELVKLLVDSLETPATPKRRLSELRGLGKEIWSGIDAQEYVNRLRDEWGDMRSV